MANVRGSKTPQGGYHTSAQIKKTMKPAYARDDINEAFAGKENYGPASNEKTASTHSTQVKSRKTKASKGRTPMR